MRTDFEKRKGKVKDGKKVATYIPLTPGNE